MTNYTTARELREGLRQYLVDATHGCAIQEATDGSGWPCGTCIMDVLNILGLDDTRPEYHECNPDRDRHNEVWRAILQIRDAELVG